MDRVLLVVDDEANILSALGRLFRRDGYTILSAGSGEEGLALLNKTTVGVIISDQRMPGMTGTEFLSLAKEIQPDSVRIVLSGYTELNSVTDAINRGSVFRFLTKPWEDDLLREQVAAAFAHYELKINYENLSKELLLKNAALEKATQLLESALVGAEGERDFGMSVLKVTQQVLHQAPVAVVGYAQDGTVAVSNQMASRLFPELCVGLSINGALPPAIRATLASGQAQGYHALPDGHRYFYQATPFKVGDAELGMILTLIPLLDNAAKTGLDS
ncbi:MAG: response regulator [Chitinimonas sp.]|nr:response regulator [Chitinimonas sp.]